MNVRARILSVLLVAATASAVTPAHADDPPAAAQPKLTKPPKLVTFVDAQYPESEKKAGKGAVVTLAITIGPDGRPSAVEVAKTAGAAFDAAAVAAAKQFVFEPAEFDGKPGSVKILYEYTFVLKEEKKTTADFSGVVRDRKTKKPIAGVTIAVTPQTGEARTATTDASGKFSFLDLAPGKVAITVSGDTLTATQTEETLEEGKRTDVLYDVTPKEAAAAPEDQDDLEIVVVAPPLQKAAVSTEVAAEQGRKVPGTSGDVVKVVESMPGVGRAAAGSGALVVWGASPEDTRVYYDGVRIPALYHLGGVRSVLAGDLVRTIELIPGGYGAAYGRGLGGVVLVESKALSSPESRGGTPDTGVHGAAMLDIIDASATVRAKISDKWRVAVAARRSHLDTVVSGFTDRDVGELFPIPRYWDGQLRLSYDRSEKERLEIGVLSSSDRVERVVASPDPERIRRDTRGLDFTRIWLRWRKEQADGSIVTLVPFFGVDSASRTNVFGSVPTELATQSTLYGLRTSWRGAATKDLAITLGLDAEVQYARMSRRGSIALPAREGDVRVFGQPPPDRINGDAWTSVVATAAPFVEGDLSLFEGKLHLVPGMRLDPYVTSVSRRTPVAGDTPPIGLFTSDLDIEPRMMVRFAPSARVRFHAAWGQYRQPPQAEDLSAVFGNPALPPSRATHYVLGGALKLLETVSLEITGFQTRSKDLGVRSPLTAPLLAEALVSGGEGRSYGAQFLLRKELASGFFGWISYTLARSERRNDESASWRRFDFDQTHVLTAVASYDLGKGFEIGSRFRYASGFPRTPVIGSSYDARRDVWHPEFGAVNSDRLPDFIQLDVRVSKRTKLGGSKDAPELETYVDVQNVTSRANAEEVVYDQTFTRKGFLRGIPILPVVGARLAW